MAGPQPSSNIWKRKLWIAGFILLPLAAGLFSDAGSRWRQRVLNPAPAASPLAPQVMPPADASPSPANSPSAKPVVPDQSTARSSMPGSSQATNFASAYPSLIHSPTPVVRFNGKRYGFETNASNKLIEFQRNLETGASSVVLLGLLERPSAELKSQYNFRGVDLLAYVPDNGWIARVHSGEPSTVPDNLSFFQPFDEAMRVHANLKLAESLREEVLVYVHAVQDRFAADLLFQLETTGFAELTLHSAGGHSYLAGKVPGDRLPDFLAITAAHPDVQLIERGSRARLLNDYTMRTTQSGDFLGSTPFFEQGIYGSNQVIAICDTGLDVDACYFRSQDGALPPTNRMEGTQVDLGRRKVIAANFLYAADNPAMPLDWDNQGHGTAVAGCAAGSDIYAPFATDADNGMAPGAQLIIQDAGFVGGDACSDLVGLGCPVTNFYPALMQAVSQGATIHNNSWGDQESAIQQNIYSEPCRELDLVTWSNKHFLVVCAAGNNGLSGTVGSPSVAKNCLSVAASMSGYSQDRIAGFSSRGWASDGRFKPDLAAPGYNLRTASSDGDITTGNCYLGGRSGTSFSAPVVSGLAALVRDYFAQGFYPLGFPIATNAKPDVSAALVKAVLINASLHMSNAMAYPPARDQGWGRVVLSQTLMLTNSNRQLLAIDHPPMFAETPAFPFKTYVKLRSTNQPFKVTLVWSDYPATPGAEKHLVNDLDLRVRTLETVLKGNVFLDGLSVTGGDFDRFNNVEQVHWMPHTNGLVEISVWAHLIAAGPQDFAVVATGDFEEIPLNQDEDEDGLADYWERWHFGHLDQSAADDPDLDQASNQAEFQADTNPNDPNSVARLAITSVTNATVTLQMKVTEGKQYSLESTASGLPSSSWFQVSESRLVGEPIVEGTQIFTDTVSTNLPRAMPRFYRIRIQGPLDLD